MKKRSTHAALAPLLVGHSVAAADPAQAPLPAGLVAADVRPGQAAAVCFLEGPAVHENGDVYFSDISGNRVLRLTGDGAWSVFRADSGRTNGNTFDARGRLLSCEGAENGPGGSRRVVRTDLATGRIEVVAEPY